MEVWSGERLKSLRLRLGWSQAELGRRLGCSHSIIDLWEKSLAAPDRESISALDNLDRQLEAQGDWVGSRTAAEYCLKNLGWSQVKTSELNVHANFLFDSESNHSKN